LEQLEITADECCVFEGTEEGCAAAKSAGITNIIGVKPAMPTRFPNRERHQQDDTLVMLENGAKTVIDNFTAFKYEYISHLH
jgi:beta-phosphoglucomutase-like phosphatase (HAD superfamily)